MLSLANRVTVVVIIGIAAIGTADAATGGAWDLVAVFAAVAVAAASMLVRSVGRRRQVSVRSDLVRWLEAYAATGDERLEDVADRVVALYRAGLLDAGPTAPAPSAP
jgi:hypothetical protein